jgi:hypothetical protein
MATKNIILKGHIQGVVNLVTSDGEEVCHLLVNDDRAGNALIKALAASGLVFAEGEAGAVGDWSTVDVKYKLHVFLGTEAQVPIVREVAP